MRLVRTLVLLALALALPPAAVRAAPPEFDSLEEGRARARAEGRPILVLILAPGQRDSEAVLRDLDRDRRLAELRSSFVVVKLDQARDGGLAAKYGLSQRPAILVLTMFGAPIKAIAGRLPPNRFAEELAKALEKNAEAFTPKRPPAPRRPAEDESKIPELDHRPDCPVACRVCDPAVEQALDWLARRQRADGGFGKLPAERVTKDDAGRQVVRSIDHVDVALASLAGMAFLASATGPDGAKRRAAAERAGEFVAGSVRPDGVACRESGNDYLYLTHANFETPLAALFLAEWEKLAPDPKRAAALDRILAYLARAQDPRSGAFGYGPDFQSFSPWERRGWRLLATTHVATSALLAGRDAGRPVFEGAVKNAVRYLLACRGRDGAFTYRAEYAFKDGEPGSTAGALFALSRSGLVEEEVLDAIRARHRRHYRVIERYGDHFWWFVLFTALALHDEGPGAAAEFDAGFRDRILAKREADGSFADPNGQGGKVYATAVAALVLRLGRGGLPIAGARSGARVPLDVVERPRYRSPPHDLSNVKVFRHGGAYRYDLVVSVDGEPSREWLASLAEALDGAHRTVYDATDGQFLLNHAVIRTGREGWEKADLRFGPEFGDPETNPRGFAHGVTRVSRRTKLENGRETEEGLRIGDFVLFPFDPEARWGERRFTHVLAHELGHYLFGALDEYDAATGESRCNCLMGRRRWTEFCTAAAHADPRTKDSCWTHAKRLYPELTIPDEPDPGPWRPPIPRITLPR